MEPVFWCENVTKSYQGVPTVEGVSLSLEEGRLVSLLGASGVGKTTLFNVLSGVDSPDSGRVLLRRGDITGKAGQVSYMLQKDLLLPYKRVVDNVILPLLLKGMPKRAARERAVELFPQFGLEGCENKYPSQLSGGMRQRAALLRTHLTGCEVILLDEPFSALDAITKMAMHEWYLGVMEKIGASTLFITHDVDEALVLSDKIYIMSGAPGKITREFTVRQGRRPPGFRAAPEELVGLKKEILAEIGL